MNSSECLENEPCLAPSQLREGAGSAPTTSESADLELATLAKALGHPARVRIVRFLLSRETCMCGDIVDHLPLAQSTVSQHLKILKEAGFIRGTIDGPRVCYCVEPHALAQFRRLVASL